MLFCESYEALWHDTDATREMRPSALLAYMQECANHQFRCHAMTLDELRDQKGVGFILSRIAIDFLSPIHAYDGIEVRTATCEGHGLCFPRRFEVLRGGEMVAKAMSQWAMVNVKDRTLVRAAEASLGFGDEEEIAVGMPLRFRIPKEIAMSEVGKRRIVYSDLDYNQHMNNTKYPDMLCDFLPDGNALRVKGMSLSYYHEAAFGDTLCVQRGTDGAGRFYFRTKKGDTVCLEATVLTVPREQV